MTHPTLSLDDARALLEAWVRSSRWLRRGAAARMQVTSFRAAGAHHVTYEQFFEARRTGPASRPYTGGEVDGPARGPSPDPWDVAVPDDPDFVTTSRTTALPHTSDVRGCHGCDGAGETRCASCDGAGTRPCAACNGAPVTCASCGGAGRAMRTREVPSTDAEGNATSASETAFEACDACGGAGSTTCGACAGAGTSTCGAWRRGRARRPATCAGAIGRLEHFVALTVERTHVEHRRTLDAADLPEPVVREAMAARVHDECGVTVPADLEAPSGERGVRVREDVDREARALVARNPLPAGARPIRERLRVSRVPIHMGVYTWGGGERRFYVYGLDQRVYAPDYPRSPLRIGAAALAVVAAVALALLALASIARG